jgi:hypothetical protein
MALNIITNNTNYISFDVYNQTNGSKMTTYDVSKTLVSSIHTHYNTKIEDSAIGLVIINTITQFDQTNKNNALLELIPAQWAPSTAPTVAYTDAASLRTALLGFIMV